VFFEIIESKFTSERETHKRSLCHGLGRQGSSFSRTYLITHYLIDALHIGLTPINNRSRLVPVTNSGI